MKTFEFKKDVGLWIIMLIPLAYLLFVWNKLPEIVPIHFNIKSEPDRWGAKSTLWYFMLMPVGIYILMLVLPSIDPKKKLQTMGKNYLKLKWLLVVFMSLFLLFIYYTSANPTEKTIYYIFALAGLLFAGLGNYMQSVKPNYFVGIRTPWTLENEEVWRKTHLMGGKLWVAGGLLLAVLTFIIPKEVMLLPFITILFVLAGIPIIYSYTLYKKIKQEETK